MHCQLVARPHSPQLTIIEKYFPSFSTKYWIFFIFPGIMMSLHRGISLETCPILLTPEPPTIVQQGGAEGKKPEYEPVTSSSSATHGFTTTSTLLALAGLSLGLVSRGTYWDFRPALLSRQTGKRKGSQTFIRKKKLVDPALLLPSDE